MAHQGTPGRPTVHRWRGQGLTQGCIGVDRTAARFLHPSEATMDGGLRRGEISDAKEAFRHVCSKNFDLALILAPVDLK